MKAVHVLSHRLDRFRSLLTMVKVIVSSPLIVPSNVVRWNGDPVLLPSLIEAFQRGRGRVIRPYVSGFRRAKEHEAMGYHPVPERQSSRWQTFWASPWRLSSGSAATVVLIHPMVVWSNRSRLRGMADPTMPRTHHFVQGKMYPCVSVYREVRTYADGVPCDRNIVFPNLASSESGNNTAPGGRLICESWANINHKSSTPVTNLV